MLCSVLATTQAPGCLQRDWVHLSHSRDYALDRSRCHLWKWLRHKLAQKKFCVCPSYQSVVSIKGFPEQNCHLVRGWFSFSEESGTPEIEVSPHVIAHDSLAFLSPPSITGSPAAPVLLLPIWHHLSPQRVCPLSPGPHASLLTYISAPGPASPSCLCTALSHLAGSTEFRHIPLSAYLDPTHRLENQGVPCSFSPFHPDVQPGSLSLALTHIWSRMVT